MILPTTPGHDGALRRLSAAETEQLERQGCSATDWEAVLVTDATDLRLIQDTDFIGANAIGALDAGQWPGCGLRRVTAEGCVFGHGVRVRDIPGRLLNCTVGDEAVIENTDRVEYYPDSRCGVGTEVNVLDETGSRPVTIYPGLTAQSAAMMARGDTRLRERMRQQTLEHINAEFNSDAEWLKLHGVGARSKVIDCGPLTNVSIGHDIEIRGASRLSNGCIVNNAEGEGYARVGTAVDAEDFIIEDGRVESGSLLRRCYVGQGAMLGKGYTAHDSLFFANSTLENGEACALFAGPYTSSIHKGTLLIGCETSFLNAGSASNQSNHLYKLGPVHWGVLERGVKTSSNSYLMLGARVGAFSLLIGSHKTHPDSRDFPFSYLFGDARGATVVVPGIMLRSCGLSRDEKKWPARSRRLAYRLPLHDRVTMDILSPMTIGRILRALEIIGTLVTRPTDDDLYLRYKGMKISRASLERAAKLYTLAVNKYLDTLLSDEPLPELTVEEREEVEGDWTDIGGQLMPAKVFERAKEAGSVKEREAIFERMHRDYRSIEREWISATIHPRWLSDRDEIRRKAREYDEIVDDDRAAYRDMYELEQRMLSL